MFGVPSEPDSGEMAPAEFTLNDVATGAEGVADSDGVVAAAAVIFGAFVLGGEIAAVFLVVLLVLVPHFIQLGERKHARTVFDRKKERNGK